LERPDDPLAVLPMTVDLNRLTGQVVLVGYGRVGRRIGKALTENGISFVVAEENREIVEQLRENGIPAVSGDAADPAVLIQAHIQRARMLVIATPDTLDVRRMIEVARTVNPRIETVVRTHSEIEAGLLEKENAGKVFLGEHELASAMIRHVLVRYAAGSEAHH
jgi:CPA2 family monovalent cation:H+ antiporter-2